MYNLTPQLTPNALTSGIYTITNLVNRKVYVGQSITVSIRWQKHKSDLRSGIHYNEDLLRDWVAFGEENFCFRFTESVEPNADALNRAEAYWIDWHQSLDPLLGYNKTSFAYPNNEETLVSSHCFIMRIGKWDVLIRKSDHYFFASGVASIFNRRVADFVRLDPIKQFRPLISNDPRSLYKGTWIDFGLIGRFGAWVNPCFELAARRAMMKISLTSNIDVMGNVEKVLNGAMEARE